MSRITPDHLARQAYVYVRQSTPDQLLHNHESRRRQYGLSDRARQLGWSEAVVIDDDLGRSGGGIARPGFERLLVAICEGWSASCSRSRRHGSPATAGTGIRCWSSAAWSDACWLMRMASTIPLLDTPIRPKNTRSKQITITDPSSSALRTELSAGVGQRLTTWKRTRLCR